MSRSARSLNSEVSDQWPAPTTSAVFTAINRMAEMTALVLSRSLSAGSNFPIDRAGMAHAPGKPGTSLVLRKGAAAEIIAGLARETGARAVFWNEIAQAPHQAVADQVTKALGEIGVAAETFPGDLLVAPSQIRNKENRGLRV